MAVAVAALALVAPASAQREAQVLDRGWGHASFDWTAGRGPAADGLDLEDSSRWRRVDLPRAELFAGSRDVFRRELRAPLERRDSAARVRLTGAPCVQAVYFDGESIEFERRGFDVMVDLGRALGDGERHELLVETDILGHVRSGSGAWPVGISRGARIEYLGDVHLDPRTDLEQPLVEWRWLAGGGAALRIAPAVVNRGAGGARVTVSALLVDDTGAAAAAGEAVVGIEGGGQAQPTLALVVPDPIAWTAAAPRLYGLTVEVAVNGRVVDEHRMTTAPRRLRDLGQTMGVGLVTYASHDDRGSERLSARALRRDAVRISELAASVAIEPTSLPMEPFLAECDLRGVDVILVERSDFSDGQRRELAGAAAAHPCVARVETVDAVQWEMVRRGTLADLPESERGDPVDRRRDHAASFARAASRFLEALTAPPAVGDGERGAFSSTRLPTLAYHRLRATAGRPTAYPAADWSDLAGGGDLTVYSSGDAVELLVDGQSLGRRHPWRGTATFANAPAAGERVVVRTWHGGRLAAERAVAAPGAPAQIMLVPDEMGIALSSVESDRVWVHALVLDAAGNLCAGFDGQVTCSLLGAGELIGEHRPLAVGGVASVLLRATGPDPITLAARATVGDGGIDSNRLTLVPDGF